MKSVQETRGGGHMCRAGDVECLHGRVVALLGGVRGVGGKRGVRVVEGVEILGEVVDCGGELQGHGGFGVMEPASWVVSLDSQVRCRATTARF
jgi:hypothetical protein